jgi:hypothetical protein
VATSINWVRPTPKNRPISLRFKSREASIGVNNQSRGRDLPLAPDGAVFCGCPCAGSYDSIVLATSTCKGCSG